MALLIRDIQRLVDQIAPPHLAYSWDRIGLQIYTGCMDISKAIVCLDLTHEILMQAKDEGAKVIIAHHPIIWEPLTAITPSSPNGSLISFLIEDDIGFIAAHTNWDCATGGVSDALLKKLGFEPELPRRNHGELRQSYKLVTFAPAESVDAIIDAGSEYGAGVIGSYARCAFTSPGEGTFDALADSNPPAGKPGERSKVQEVKIEMVVPEHCAFKARSAMLHAHPYESPPIDVIPLRPEPIQDSIRVALPSPMSLREITGLVEEKLETKCLSWPWLSDPDHPVERVAAAGGAAGKMWKDGQRAIASVFITGEISHDQVIAANDHGMSIIQAGHYATEAPGMMEMARRLNELDSGVEFVYAEPWPGTGGRPMPDGYVRPELD